MASLVFSFIFISVIAKQHTTVIPKSRILLLFDGLLLPVLSFRHETNWKMSDLIPIDALVANLTIFPLISEIFRVSQGKKVPF